MFSSKGAYIDYMIVSNIAAEKYCQSNNVPNAGIIQFCPITVPVTVDFLLNRVRSSQEEQYEGMLIDIDFISGRLRLDLILGYFGQQALEPLVWRNRLGYGKEESRSTVLTSRIEGEIRRYAADFCRMDPHDVKPTPRLVEFYCLNNMILPIQSQILRLLDFEEPWQASAPIEMVNPVLFVGRFNG